MSAPELWLTLVMITANTAALVWLLFYARQMRSDAELWRDRCHAADQALDATIKSYEQELRRIGGESLP